MQLVLSIETFLLLLWVTTLPSCMVAQCDRSTCLNGGSCDPDYKGSGFRCVCPKFGTASPGPRCEAVTRRFGFKLPADRNGRSNFLYASTVHDISDHVFDATELLITFEMLGLCEQSATINRRCSILSVRGSDFASDPIPLVQLQLDSGASADHRLNEFYLWTPSNFGSPKISADLDLEVDSRVSLFWRQHWQAVTIRIQMDPTNDGNMISSLQVCSLKLRSCLTRTISQAYIPVHNQDLMDRLRGAKLSVGSFSGCVRFLRVNSELVDLQDGTTEYQGRFRDPHPLTSLSCTDLEQPCTDSNSAGVPVHFCGADSQCDAQFTGDDSGRGDAQCQCTCTNSKRRPVETVSNSDRCTAGTVAPWNECSMDSPVMRSGSSNYEVKWTDQFGNRIRLDLRFFSVEASIRTLERNVAKVLSFDGDGSWPHIRISDGFLSVCIDAACYQFPEATVSDNEWHEFSVTFRDHELATMLDKASKIHWLERAVRLQNAVVSLTVPNSCIRAVRVSNIYMPTGGNDSTTERRTAFIRVKLGEGVHVAYRCDDATPQNDRTPSPSTSPSPSQSPSPSMAASCNCSEGEQCDRTGASPACVCSNHYARNHTTGRCELNVHSVMDLMIGMYNGGGKIPVGITLATLWSLPLAISSIAFV